MSDHDRATDRWLKWVAVIGPIIGVLFGVCSGAVVTYQAFKNDGNRISLIEGWKEKQEDFNKVTISAIATLQEVVKHIK